MTIDRIDSRTLDLDTAQQLAEVTNASMEVSSPDHVRTNAAVQLGLAHHTFNDRPYDAMWIARDDAGSPIGHATMEFFEWDNLDAGMGFCTVHPAHWRRGVGSALLDLQLAMLREHGRAKLFTFPMRDSAAERLLVERGGSVGQHTAQRRLEPKQLDFDHVTRLHDEAATTAADYELVRLVGMPTDEWLAHLVELTEAINDAPTDDIDLEDDVFSEERIRAHCAALDKRGQVVYRLMARHRETGAWAGHTVLCVDTHRPGVAFQEDTSVIRAHRGHRLGMLLKTAMLLWMREEHPELETIDTWNAESNHHMIAVNEALGCRVVNLGSAVTVPV